MRTFLAGLVLAILLAVASGVALETLEIGSERFQKTDNARL